MTTLSLDLPKAWDLADAIPDGLDIEALIANAKHFRSTGEKGALIANPDGFVAVPAGLIKPVTLAGRPVPERKWIVDGLVPAGHVTLLAGDGGTGKTLVSLQLAVACALGKMWLGRPTKACRALVFACEDDPDELHRRLEDICRHYGADLADLENLTIWSRVCQDNYLMQFENWGAGDTTDLYVELMNYAIEDEATRQIKANPKTKHIPIIAVLAFAMYDDRDKALAAGCDAYYSKPVDFHLLRTHIKELLPEAPEESV